MTIEGHDAEDADDDDADDAAVVIEDMIAGGIRGSGRRDRGPMQQQSAMLAARSIGGFSVTGLSVSRSRESLSREFRFRRRSCDSSLELTAGGRFSWNRYKYFSILSKAILIVA